MARQEKQPGQRQRPTPPPWLALTVAAGAAFIAGLDNLVVSVALPQIQQGLGTDIAGLTWTVNAYTLTFSVFMLGAAALGDRIGRRHVFQAGVALFTLASAGVALSPGIVEFGVFRAVQGLGAAMLVPLSLTLVLETIPKERRTISIAIWSGAQGLAVALGPFVGGLVVEVTDWQWIFWVNVPLGICVLGAALIFPNTSVASSSRFDATGLVLMSLAILGIALALVNSADHGWDAPLTACSFLGGAVCLGAFLLWERRVANPVLPPALFRSRGFGLTNLNALLLTAGVFGAVFLLMQYLQTVLGYTPLEAGVRSLPWTLVPAVAAPVSGALAERYGTKPVLATGSFLQAAALAWFALTLGGEVDYLVLVPGMVLAGVGMGAFFAVVATQAIAFVPEADEGLGSGVTNSVREIGVLLGVAVLTAVFLAAGESDPTGAFASGLSPALWTGSGLIALASIIALITPRPAPKGGDAAVATSMPAPRAAGRTGAARS